MKTSVTQFEIMVTFMEQNGDLNKPFSNARGRINNIKKWEELSALLNSDGSGDSKTTEKWKKVWSDFKNNTKKKAARIHRAATGTGGGPAVYAKLSDLEQRVLNLIGVQVATGLAAEEAGVPEPPESSHMQSNVTAEAGTSSQHGECNQDGTALTANIASDLPRAISSPPLVFVEEEILSSQAWTEPGPSGLSHVLPHRTSPNADLQVENASVLSPTRPSQVHVARPEPALSGQTTPRHTVSARPRRTHASPRVRARPTYTDQATQQFLRAEENWREFKQQQHRDYMDMRSESLRIRHMELDVQRAWQATADKALDILNKLVDKYCKD